LHSTDHSIPLTLHATYEEASAFRKWVRADPKRALEAVKLDTIPALPGDFLSVSIVTFVEGRPVEEETYDLD
jgi:hypothetical protein